MTKAPRAAAALVLAPLVDRLMGWLQRVCNLQSRRQVGRGGVGKGHSRGPSGGANGWPARRRGAWPLQAGPRLPGSAPPRPAQVFGWFVACCLGLALTLFSVVVLAWA